jgi:hypothetical protein
MLVILLFRAVAAGLGHNSGLVGDVVALWQQAAVAAAAAGGSSRWQWQAAAAGASNTDRGRAAGSNEA